MAAARETSGRKGNEEQNQGVGTIHKTTARPCDRARELPNHVPEQ